MNIWHLICFVLAFIVGKTIKNYDKNKLIKEISNLKSIISETKSNENFLKLKAFREGDLVFTANDKFNFNKPYYIINFYNNGHYARIYPDPNHKGNLFEGTWGISVTELQHKQFPKCNTCGKDY